MPKGAVAADHGVFAFVCIGLQARLKVAHIATRAEKACAAAQHQGPHGIVLSGLDEHVGQLGHHLGRQGVARFGSVQRDPENVVRVLHQQVLVVHVGRLQAAGSISPILRAITISITSSAPPPIEPSR